MGFLSFLFGKTHTIEDPFFEKMVFLDWKNEPEKDYFECQRYFEPIEAQIELGIQAHAEGPNPKQKEFFKQIEMGYADLSKEWIPLLESEFRNWKEDFTIADFQQEFKAVYMFLPNCLEEPKLWEIAFETEHDSHHYISISMKDFKAIGIHIDG